MHEFFERLGALFFNPDNNDPGKAKHSSLGKLLLENGELLVVIIALIVSGIGAGFHKMATERARLKLPQGCPPHCASAQLAGLGLREVELENADLCEANLSGANLTSATLRRANLSGANLQRAQLWQAILANADLRGADLANAVLGEADLTGARLDSADLSGAWYSEGTIWPAGFAPSSTARKTEGGCYIDERGWRHCRPVTQKNK